MKGRKNQRVILSYVCSFFTYVVLSLSRQSKSNGRKGHRLMQDYVHWVRGMGLLFVLWAIIGWLAPSVEAATYYVNWLGSDTSPGTSIMPFRTIKKGISVLKAGDTLIIRAGTYTEGLEYYHTIPSGTDNAHRTIIKAAPGETVIINGRNGSGDVWTIYDRSYITLDGITIDGVNAYFCGLRIGRSAVGAPGSHYITVQNGTVRNVPYSGIVAQGTASANSHYKYINLEVHHCGTGSSNQHHGIYLGVRDSIVERCSVHDNLAYGIHAYSSSGGVNNNIIRNNKVYNNGSFGIILSAGYNNLAYNNILWGNGKRTLTGGIFASYAGVSGSKIYNNTIYGNTGYCIWIKTDGSAKAINNICWQNSYNSILDDTGTATISRNLFTNPYFVNPLGLNFSVLAKSPAINAGTTLSEVPNDFNGLSRPQGSAYDAGAFEKTP